MHFAHFFSKAALFFAVSSNRVRLAVFKRITSPFRILIGFNKKGTEHKLYGMIRFMPSLSLILYIKFDGTINVFSSNGKEMEKHFYVSPSLLFSLRLSYIEKLCLHLIGGYMLPSRSLRL